VPPPDHQPGHEMEITRKLPILLGPTCHKRWPSSPYVTPNNTAITQSFHCLYCCGAKIFSVQSRGPCRRSVTNGTLFSDDQQKAPD